MMYSRSALRRHHLGPKLTDSFEDFIEQLQYGICAYSLMVFTMDTSDKLDHDNIANLFRESGWIDIHNSLVQNQGIQRTCLRSTLQRALCVRFTWGKSCESHNIVGKELIERKPSTANRSHWSRATLFDFNVFSLLPVYVHDWLFYSTHTEDMANISNFYIFKAQTTVHTIDVHHQEKFHQHTRFSPAQK